VREVRTPIYTRFRSRVALAGLYGAVRGNARSGERHVTARAVTASLVRLCNNPSAGVPNNKNNSSRTALAGDQITLLEGNNNSGSVSTGG
jgi:hypothetical protein